MHAVGKRLWLEHFIPFYSPSPNRPVDHWTQSFQRAHVSPHRVCIPYSKISCHTCPRTDQRCGVQGWGEQVPSSTLKIKPHVEYKRQELALHMARETAKGNIPLSESQAGSPQLHPGDRPWGGGAVIDPSSLSQQTPLHTLTVSHASPTLPTFLLPQLHLK